MLKNPVLLRCITQKLDSRMHAYNIDLICFHYLSCLKHKIIKFDFYCIFLYSKNLKILTVTTVTFLHYNQLMDYSLTNF